MNRRVIVFGLLAMLLFLAACAPTAPDMPAGEVAVAGQKDVDVLVYASPL